jgi:hypothetical protein
MVRKCSRKVLCTISYQLIKLNTTNTHDPSIRVRQGVAVVNSRISFIISFSLLPAADFLVHNSGSLTFDRTRSVSRTGMSADANTRRQVNPFSAVTPPGITALRMAFVAKPSSDPSGAAVYSNTEHRIRLSGGTVSLLHNETDKTRKNAQIRAMQGYNSYLRSENG